jgi:hypothetical protein
MKFFTGTVYGVLSFGQTVVLCCHIEMAIVDLGYANLKI